MNNRAPPVSPKTAQQQQLHHQQGALVAGGQAGSRRGSGPGQTMAQSLVGRQWSAPTTAHMVVSPTDFPILPAPQPVVGQVAQTDQQVAAILSLPPTVLAKLARTGDLAQQQQIASSSRIDPYLPFMALPAPPMDSPAVEDVQYAGGSRSHPGIPHILHQVFSPNSAGILAPSTEAARQHEFQPTYRSVDDWAIEVARHTAVDQSLDPVTTQAIASQLKQWALHSQEAQVEQHVVEARASAVTLAAQAEAAVRTARTSGLALSPQTFAPDLSPYASTYRDQLANTASGYYHGLHKDAIRNLQASGEPPAFASSAPASRRHSVGGPGAATPERATAMNVQAAAVAALTANVMAATELAHRGRERLEGLGMPVPDSLTSALPRPGPAAIAATQQSLAQHHQQKHQLQQQQHHASSRRGSANGYLPGAAPSAPVQQHQKQDQVTRLLLSAERTGQCTEEARNYLLAYAHTVYSKTPQDENLLPLLHTLAKLHPGHLPTLLLLSCVYYSAGQYELSVHYNEEILRIDPDYVEAMSNIGTTKRAMGAWKEAEDWWWKAVKLRPTYFDAFDNLLGVLCNPNQPKPPGVPPAAEAGPRYAEALQLCELVEGRLFGAMTQRPLRLPSTVPPTHAHRLQNLFYAKGNLRVAEGNSVLAREEYEKALEIVLSPSSRRRSSGPESVGHVVGYGLTDLILATVCVGWFMMAANAAGTVEDPAVWEALAQTGLWDKSAEKADDVIRNPLDRARRRRSLIVDRLLQLGGGVLPYVLILPSDLEKLSSLVFNESVSVLPALQDLVAGQPTAEKEHLRNPSLQATNQTTSTVLLTLAKCFQDAIPSPSIPGASLDRVPPSSSMLLPIYFLALTLHPSPSTCNNLGILLSTIPATMTASTPQGQHTYNGQLLAHQYYLQGLNKDPMHPHLYTNLGSLLKDMGRLPEAVTMYEKAVECNPNFDVALANLANAIKDMGRVQDSVQWYMRAVQLNPNFPEAVCGLVNALGGVCDWQDRGAVGNEPVVDQLGNLLGPPPASPEDGKQRAGWMGKVSRLVDKQLDDGAAYGKGVIKLTSSIDDWLDLVAAAWTGSRHGFSEEHRAKWRARFEPFFGDRETVQAEKLNEGGFLIRVIEKALRRIQRRCYIATYGKVLASPDQQASLLYAPDSLRPFSRVPLPSSLSTPPVPTVLPFHTFTYPLTPRECRLISHRNALRISLTTLNQPWLPRHVYPPPPPPCGKLNIGYISSDFNNHPLAHLMQSVFGMHDRSRFRVFCYATTPPDGSTFRKKIETEAEHFRDVSAWSNDKIIEQTLADGIHILINLNGYTKGARNEIFAARPCPVQIEFMGFAGTIASGFTDWIVADPVVCPPEMTSSDKWHRQRQAFGSGEERPTDLEGDLDPEEAAEDWVYTEKFIYMPHSYFVCDHKQGFRDETAEPDLQGVPAPVPRIQPPAELLWPEEEARRWGMRKQLFPTLPDNFVIFANFNQLYKIDPLIFKVWLDVLKAVPNSILWLLRFPQPGEPHLKATAERWAGPEIAARVVFTDVAPKQVHIQRGRVADLFLDSTECNAHTTAADILWTATPILTLPRSSHKHKMCSRVAASIALATGFGPQMIVNDVDSYLRRAVSLAATVRYTPQAITIPGPDGSPMPMSIMKAEGELAGLRRKLYETRELSPLFDTARWTRNLERGYELAWERWVEGTDSEDLPEWEAAPEGSKLTSHIYLDDAAGGAGDLGAAQHRAEFATTQLVAGEEVVS